MYSLPRPLHSLPRPLILCQQILSARVLYSKILAIFRTHSRRSQHTCTSTPSRSLQPSPARPDPAAQQPPTLPALPPPSPPRPSSPPVSSLVTYYTTAPDDVRALQRPPSLCPDPLFLCPDPLFLCPAPPLSLPSFPSDCGALLPEHCDELAVNEKRGREGEREGKGERGGEEGREGGGGVGGGVCYLPWLWLQIEGPRCRARA